MLADDTNEGRLLYTHRLAPGVTGVMMYGLRLAQSICLPQSVLQRAKQICHNLEENKLVKPVYHEGKTEAEEDQEYIEEMLKLIQSNTFSLSEVRQVQNKLIQRYQIGSSQENTRVLETSNIENNETYNADSSNRDESAFHPAELNVCKTTHSGTTFTNTDSSFASFPPRSMREYSFGKSSHNSRTSHPTIEKETTLTSIRTRSPLLGKEQNFVTHGAGTSVNDFCQNTPTRQSTAHTNSPNTSQSLELNVPHPPLRTVHNLENVDETPSRKSIRYSNEELDNFNFQANQRATIVNSPKIQNPIFPLVPYSFSQSSHRHSSEALNQCSQQTEFPNTIIESSFYDSLSPSPPKSDTAQQFGSPPESIKNVNTPVQQHIYNESSPMLENEDSESSGDNTTFNNSNQYHRYLSYEADPNNTPHRSSQGMSGSHYSMVMHLSPNFERITRTVYNTPMDYNNDDDDDDDSFEE